MPFLLTCKLIELFFSQEANPFACHQERADGDDTLTDSLQLHYLSLENKCHIYSL